jgi:protein-tyrosine phosphatase/membrane-associated phospholipid phosphatase
LGDLQRVGRPAGDGVNWKAARTSGLLSLLFVVAYGASNYLASLRHDVGSFVFPWERQIPFVPWMIIPYMSIDLFYIASPFLCQGDLERRTLARRISAAILIAAGCFVLVPLRFSFERPHVEGWLGTVFNSFREVDQPFNQFPSLHITLGVILAVFYSSRVHGFLRVLVWAWFAAIGVSAVLTYQHHMIDVWGGLVLAAVCFHFVCDQPLRQPVASNFRVGFYYLIGAGLLAGGILAWPHGAGVLAWPACSLALVAAAYFGLGPGVYRKQAGRLPVSSWLLLGPMLLGQQLSLAWYARQCRAWDLLTDRVWIGRKLSDAEARNAVSAGVIAVLDLTGEFSETRPFLGQTYLQLPVLDLTAPTDGQMDLAAEFIKTQSVRGVVYVHCKVGYSRTAAVAGAYLLANGQARSADEAMGMLRAARPSIVIRPEAEQAIRSYARRIAHGVDESVSTGRL